jgi:hypothetical protein
MMGEWRKGAREQGSKGAMEKWRKGDEGEVNTDM